jgi:hypothetical protein
MGSTAALQYGYNQFQYCNNSLTVLQWHVSLATLAALQYAWMPIDGMT